QDVGAVSGRLRRGFRGRRAGASPGAALQARARGRATDDAEIYVRVNGAIRSGGPWRAWLASGAGGGIGGWWIMVVGEYGLIFFSTLSALASGSPPSPRRHLPEMLADAGAQAAHFQGAA